MCLCHPTREVNTILIHFMLPSFQLYFDTTKSHPQPLPLGALYCKVKTLQYLMENPNYRIIPYEQALGNRGKEKLPFDSNKAATEPG